jgi:hypothetical protein
MNRANLDTMNRANLGKGVVCLILTSCIVRHPILIDAIIDLATGAAQYRVTAVIMT